LWVHRPFLFLFPGFGRATGANPCIHFWKLALPEAANAMGRKAFVFNPSVDGVNRDPEVTGDLGDGVPTTSRRGRVV
jgi:hypothetical protein